MAVERQQHRRPVACPLAQREPHHLRRHRVLHDHPSRLELATGPLLVAAAVLFWAVSIADSLRRTMAMDEVSVQAAGIMTVVILSLLIASSGTYLVARQGPSCGSATTGRRGARRWTRTSTGTTRT